MYGALAADNAHVVEMLHTKCYIMAHDIRANRYYWSKLARIRGATSCLDFFSGVFHITMHADRVEPLFCPGVPWFAIRPFITSEDWWTALACVCYESYRICHKKCFLPTKIDSHQVLRSKVLPMTDRTLVNLRRTSGSCHVFEYVKMLRITLEDVCLLEKLPTGQCTLSLIMPNLEELVFLRSSVPIIYQAIDLLLLQIPESIRKFTAIDSLFDEKHPFEYRKSWATVIGESCIVELDVSYSSGVSDKILCTMLKCKPTILIADGCPIVQKFITLCEDVRILSLRRCRKLSDRVFVNAHFSGLQYVDLTDSVGNLRCFGANIQTTAKKPYIKGLLDIADAARGDLERIGEHFNLVS